MSDSAPVVTPGRPADAVAYRPLSGLALAGFIVAAIYSVGVLILAVVALYVKTPVFLGTWTFAIPVAAMALAAVAGQQIRRSEGTRTGMALANWAWWLALLTGLGYGAFYVGSYFAVVRLQADPFARAWLDKVHRGKLNEAFLDTRPPTERLDNPDDARAMYIRYGLPGRKGKPSPLIAFKKHEIVRVIQQAGPGLAVQPLGVSSWGYDEGGYYVEQAYRVTTPEGTFDVPVLLRGTQTKKGREWQVVWDNRTGFLAATPTLLGRTVESWRAQAPLFAHEWLSKADREELPIEGAEWLGPDKRMRDQLLTDVQRDFRNPQILGIGVVQPLGYPRQIDEGRSQLQVGVAVELQGVAGDKIRYQAEGVLVLESLPGPLTPERTPDWRVVRLDLLRGGPPATPEQPHGPIPAFSEDAGP